MSLNALIKINGVEITEHGRTFSSNNAFENFDLELASGLKRRYYKDPDYVFQFNWRYVPDKASMSADGRAAGDFLKSIVESKSNVSLEIKRNNDSEWEQYSCLVTEYTENLLRHSLQSQCKYYDITLSLESL